MKIDIRTPNDDNSFQSTSFDVSAFRKPVDLSEVGRSKEITFKPSATGADDSIAIDANAWLPFCAEHYNISPRLSDYVMVPVPAVVTDIPNTNGDCLTTKEALTFRPDLGMMMYKTWKGKPTHVEHQNKDITKAKGVILDCYMKAMPQFRGNHARIIQLLAFDRTKDPELYYAIKNNLINTYSIGMWYQAYTCSICGHTVRKDNLNAVCSHTVLNKPTYAIGDRLCYRKLHLPVGFENSSVADPAYVSNHHNPTQVMSVQ